MNTNAHMDSSPAGQAGGASPWHGCCEVIPDAPRVHVASPPAEAG